MTTARDLIDMSYATDRVAEAEWTPELALALLTEAEDHVDVSPTEQEYWGGDDDGWPWRVRLVGPRTEEGI